MQNIDPDFKEVLDTNQVLMTPVARTLSFIAVMIFLYLFISLFLNPDMHPYSYFLFPIMFIMMAWVGWIHHKARKAFWKTIANKYGWNYIPRRDITHEKGLVFHLGHSQRGHQSIEGSYLNHPFSIFEYSYSTGSGRDRSTYYFTVFEIKFNGTFPHIYLNYKKDWLNTATLSFNAVNISLPTEFAKMFKLLAPKEYEAETLELFTPDLFQSLLDLGWDYDMEFVEGELVIYRIKTFSNFYDLDTETKRVQKIIDLLAPKLNKMKLTPIGDIPHRLR